MKKLLFILSVVIAMGFASCTGEKVYKLGLQNSNETIEYPESKMSSQKIGDSVFIYNAYYKNEIKLIVISIK